MKALNNVKGSAILCLAALIWGLAFVVQTQATDLVPPFLFNSLRCFVGAVFLLLLLLFRRGVTKKSVVPRDKAGQKRALIAGIACGITLALSINLQQTGMTVYPDGVAVAARSSFLTALYVVIVPVMSVFTKNRPGWVVWAAVAVALGGIYLLTLSSGFSGIYLGDVLMIFCAFSCALHILAVFLFGSTLDGMFLSMLQFIVAGFLSGILSICTEEIVWENVLTALPQILYMGIISSGVGYTLQIFGQRYAEPAVSSISMSLESVFGALGGWIILGNTLTPRELAGCVVVFCAIILAQVPQFFETKKKKQTESEQTQ